MTVRVEEFELGGFPLEGYCVFTPYFAALAVDPNLPPAVKRAKQLRAYGDWIKPPPVEDRPYLAAYEIEQVEEVAVRSTRRVVSELEPEWVECVKEECVVTNIPKEIAGRCGLDLTAVVAIIQDLVDAGEIEIGAG